MKEEIKVAVLMTCHNRRDKTLTCLKLLMEAEWPDGLEKEIFLVDDGSTDGTRQAIEEQFPWVNLIEGDGLLFWNQGMRLAWENAVTHSEFNFFFWLNDDTFLENHSIVEMWNAYSAAERIEKKPVVVVGACRESIGSQEFSYGGRTDAGPVIPNGELQLCKYVNGNVVWVPIQIYNEIGNLSSSYSHSMGDFDYGLRTINAGFNCYSTKKYIAVCPRNEGIPSWCDPEIPVCRRLKLIHSNLGLNISEYNHFRKTFWGRKWILFAIKAYLKAIFPRIYFYLQKDNKAGKF